MRRPTFDSFVGWSIAVLIALALALFALVDTE